MTLVAGSTFSGIGGMDIALECAGIPVAWSSEVDANCNTILAHRFPTVPRLGDISHLGAHNASPVDLLVGGFPCQDLSVAGRRAGLAGEKSRLFYEFARVTEELKPRWIVLENVPGLLSSRGGRDMGAVLGTLAELGFGFAYRVLDAQYTGVPQRRRRVVIVGCAGDGASAGAVLFESEGGSGNLEASRGEREIVAPLFANGVGVSGADDNQARAGHLIARTLTASNQRCDGDTETFIPVAFRATQTPVSSTKKFPTLSTACGVLGVLWQGYPAVHQGIAVRRLTPTECERLQGFPAGWTAVAKPNGKPMSDSARYRMIGNAVAVPVFAWVFKRLALVHQSLINQEVADVSPAA